MEPEEKEGIRARLDRVERIIVKIIKKIEELEGKNGT